MTRMSTLKVSIQFEPPGKLNAVGTAQEPVATSHLVYLLRFPLKGSIIQLVSVRNGGLEYMLCHLPTL